MSETHPAAALPAKWCKLADMHDRIAERAEMHGHHGIASRNKGMADMARNRAQELDASLHAQAEPPASPDYVDGIRFVDRPGGPPGNYRVLCCRSCAIQQGQPHLTGCEIGLREAQPAPDRIARERAYAFQWCLEHAAREDGRREDCRECQLPAQNLRDAIAAVQRSATVDSAAWGEVAPCSHFCGHVVAPDLCVNCGQRHGPAPAPTGDLESAIAQFMDGPVRSWSGWKGPCSCLNLASCGYCAVEEGVRELLRKALPALPGVAEPTLEALRVNAELDLKRCGKHADYTTIGYCGTCGWALPLFHLIRTMQGEVPGAAETPTEDAALAPVSRRRIAGGHGWQVMLEEVVPVAAETPTEPECACGMGAPNWCGGIEHCDCSCHEVPAPPAAPSAPTTVRCVCGHPGDNPACPVDHDQIQHEQTGEA